MNICPAKAINMEPDHEGFLYPVINRKSCISCARCEEVCPVNQIKYFKSHSETAESTKYASNKLGCDNVEIVDNQVYAAWSLDEHIRYNSTSGGVFSELALNVLGRGGYVCGAVYDDRFLVHHVLSDNSDSLLKIRQSKYIQSDIGDCMQLIKNELTKGKEVLFCGTPCQCGGLKNFLGGELTGLLTVDFICRGVNSGKVFRKYLDALEEKYHAPVTRVWFKNKEYGWNRFCTRIDFANGEKYLSDRYHDPFMRGFIEKNLYMRPACSSCQWKQGKTAADITLGDFWGIEMEAGLNSDLGTSYVKINSTKGREIWDRISPRLLYRPKSLDEAKRGNVCIDKAIVHDPARESFFASLDTVDILTLIGSTLEG